MSQGSLDSLDFHSCGNYSAGFAKLKEKRLKNDLPHYYADQPFPAIWRSKKDLYAAVTAEQCILSSFFLLLL